MATANHECLFKAAGDYIRRGSPTDSERSQIEDGEFFSQVRLLREWATQSGRLISFRKFDHLQPLLPETSEHIVYYDELGERAVKKTRPGDFGWVPYLDGKRWTPRIAKPLEYLVRWQLFNRVFGDNVKLEGIIASDGDQPELISVVISQCWRRAARGTHPTPSATKISKFLRKLEFQEIPNSFFGWQRRKDGLIVLDTRPDNFINTEDNLAPIDLLMTQMETQRLED